MNSNRTMEYVADADVHTEVPYSLKRLLKCIVRAFYSISHAIVIDTLIIHPCVKEDDLLEHLKFEKKQLRALVNTLKTDKFIKSRLIVETCAETNATTRHNYYFINYSAFVNVVKYKLDHMRHKIEVEERDSTSRASFKCPSCAKTFTDLEVDRIVDPFTGKLMCDHCEEEVEEDGAAMPSLDSRTLMVKFNEQVEPLYALLREVEDIKLSEDILRPEPMDLNVARSQSTRKATPGEKSHWSGDATRNIDYFGGSSEVSVNITDDATAEAANKVPAKEAPKWLTQSTITNLHTDEQDQTAVPDKPSNRLAAHDDDIMKTLLVHEKKPSRPRVSHVPQADGDSSNSSSSSSDSDDDQAAANAILTDRQQRMDLNMFHTPRPTAPSPAIGTATGRGDIEMMSSDSDDDDDHTMVIGGERIGYSEITPAMVNNMTPQEKEAYIKKGQQLYSDMYD